MNKNSPYSAVWVIAAIVALLSPEEVVAQGTIVFGTRNSKTTVPFGIDVLRPPSYIGEYQQIYSRNGFSSPVLITGIGFAQTNPGQLQAQYDFSVGLGVTSRNPASPGASFQTGAVTLFSGPLSSVFTPIQDDFDLFIPFGTSFYYDPSQGNLFLDVVMRSASGDNVIFALDSGGSSMGSLWTSGGSVVSQANWGLVTELSVVPEPSVSALILLGAGALVWRRPRKARVERLPCSGPQVSTRP